MDGTNPEGPQPDAPSGGGVGGDWISTLIAAGGMVYNAYQNRQNVKDTIGANKEQAELAYQRELEAWNRNNDYNSPANQMARLKSAGLNPNLAYQGASSGGGNSAAQMPKYNAPTLQYNRQPYVDLPQLINMYQNFRMRQAQVDNVKAQTENTQVRTTNESLQSGILGLTKRRGEFDLDKATQLRPYQMQIAQNETEGSTLAVKRQLEQIALMKQQQKQGLLQQSYTRSQTAGSNIENEKKAAELLFMQYRNEWMKMGVTTSDNPFLRIITRMLGESGAIDTVIDMKNNSSIYGNKRPVGF